MRSDDTMTKINSDSVEFCQPSSMAEPTSKIPRWTLQREGEGEVVGDTRDGGADK